MAVSLWIEWLGQYIGLEHRGCSVKGDFSCLIDVAGSEILQHGNFGASQDYVAS